jgi:hypothetical protein
MSRRVQVLSCTIEIEHTERSLHAHVDLAGEVNIRPGDRVLVLGEPVIVRFGDRFTLHRQARVERAGFVERQLTRLLATLSLSELYEVSFTPGSLS